LIQKLEYKAKAQGKHLVKIDQWFASSKTCSCCGQKVDSMPLKVRSWTCTPCGTEHDRDINAAINIRQQGVIKLRAEGLSVPANRGLRKSGHVPAAA
ncbi:MAG: zinc ribbon domain-containing protein, partial [Marinobacterium sp.]